MSAHDERRQPIALPEVLVVVRLAEDQDRLLPAAGVAIAGSDPRLEDARAIADELTQREAKLNLGGAVRDPTDPVGRLLFNVLAMVAEFESDLIRMRTREGMKVAKAKGRLRGKQPKLSATQEAHLVKLYRAGEHTVSELEELFPVTRSTIYRAIARAGGRAPKSSAEAIEPAAVGSG